MLENFKKRVLENGMTILFEKRDVPVVSVAFAVCAGGNNEALSEKGISHFKGGEPFAYKDLSELLNYSADKGLSVFITSNGTLIGDKEAQNLGEVYKKTGGKVILSLNGPTSEVDGLLRQDGTYEKTVEELRLLRKKLFKK